MDAVGATHPTYSGHLDLSWNKPVVKLLLITGVALAVLGALVLVGVNYPVGILAVLANTFKPVGAGFLMGSGITTFLFTAFATFVGLRKPSEHKELSVAEPIRKDVAEPRKVDAPPPRKDEPRRAPSNPYGHKPAAPPQPQPEPTGSKGHAGDHPNVSIELED